MRRSAALSCVLALALAGCTSSEFCGVRPPEGGPPVIATREQELCELARIRTNKYLAGLEVFTEDESDLLYSAARGWEKVDSVDELLEAIRDRDHGALADEIADVTEWVRGKSSHSYAATCKIQDRCLARGAAHGVRLALQHSDTYVTQEGIPLQGPHDDADTSTAP